MCIIMQRPAGVDFDKDKFITAFKNNPHGFGFCVPDWCGQLVVHKYIPKEDEDIEAVAEDLYDELHSEFKDDPLMLHMRWTTAGETSLRNAHPFPILEYDADGVDVRMAHNGTIYKYKPTHNAKNKWESDTRCFVREFVRPLFKRLSKGMTSEEIFTDPFIYQMLSELIPDQSVLAFIDGYGNTLEVHPTGNGGEYQEDGVWVSNTYSFREGHRTPKTPPSQTGGSTGPAGKAPHGYEEWWSENYGLEGYSYNKPDTKGDKSEEKGKVITLSEDQTKRQREHATDTKTVRFSDKYGITDPAELYGLTDDWLDLIEKESPEDMKLLVKELLNDNYCMNLTIQNLQKKMGGKANVG